MIKSISKSLLENPIPVCQKITFLSLGANTQGNELTEVGPGEWPKWQIIHYST